MSTHSPSLASAYVPARARGRALHFHAPPTSVHSPLPRHRPVRSRVHARMSSSVPSATATRAGSLYRMGATAHPAACPRLAGACSRQRRRAGLRVICGGPSYASASPCACHRRPPAWGPLNSSASSDDTSTASASDDAGFTRSRRSGASSPARRAAASVTSSRVFCPHRFHFEQLSSGRFLRAFMLMCFSGYILLKEFRWGIILQQNRGDYSRAKYLQGSVDSRSSVMCIFCGKYQRGLRSKICV